MTDLIVESIHKTLGQQHVLKGASFSAGRGTITALLGASGSGKSTLLRCIAGLEQCESGSIIIDERKVVDAEAGVFVPPEKRQIGLVFQSYALWPHRTVEENVGYGLRLRKVSEDVRRTRVAAILAQMGLGHLSDRYPSQLSGGQQQRVAICRALVYNPKVLLLDEPLSNLDQKLRDEARYWIRKLILDLQICAILVTHDQNEALAVADDIMLLQEGAIVERGTPEALYLRPTTFYAANFMGTNNVIDGRLERHTAQGDVISGEGWSLPGVLQGQIGASPGGTARAVIRTEEVCICESHTPDAFEMELRDTIFLGDRWEYRLVRGDLKVKAYGNAKLPTGRTMIRLPRDKVWIFA